MPGGNRKVTHTEINLQLCTGVSFFLKLQAGSLQLFLKKETQVQVFSCENWGILKNAVFTEHIRTNASDLLEEFLI